MRPHAQSWTVLPPRRSSPSTGQRAGFVVVAGAARRRRMDAAGEVLARHATPAAGAAAGRAGKGKRRVYVNIPTLAKSPGKAGSMGIGGP
eukprot:scaffold2643_cov387-Prasinococcus_capsulatus_cf.AAC.7